MRAVVVEQFGPPSVARIAEVPVPPVGPGQVRVAVASAAINPVDLVTRRGALHEAGLHDAAPVRLGWDVAGTVTAVGAGVRRLREGQRVIGLSDRLSAPSKTHADQVLLDETAVAAVDEHADLISFGALPLAGLTAWQALDLAHVGAGSTLLVTGAAGRVGSTALQLALLRGANVLGAGRTGHRPLVEATGATFVDAAGLAEHVRDVVPGGVDAAIDAAALGAASLDAVRSGGRHVSLVVTESPAPLRGVASSSLAVRADWQQLALVSHLASTGALRLPQVTTIGLDDAVAAYAQAEKADGARYVLVPEAVASSMDAAPL
ncbi:NADP-dependent oxidoreductase [Luteimicrobium sp. DT211]|uniref:NADP-dependent oxidoreductase n=1 Tax=Luteimicrobium sp. DT211 TaxID=3393412 RepID=UPI003CE737CF